MRDREVQDVLPAVTSVAVLGAGFVALGLDISWFWLIWVVGFVTLVPLTAILSDALLESEPADESATRTDEEQALEALRERYAEGKIDEAEFERRLDALLDTETVEQAREWATDDPVTDPGELEVDRDRS